MVGTDEIKSIIAADFGSVNTRIVLIDLVDGKYRLVARSLTRTTIDDPLRDVAVGFFRGLELLAEQTGRDFVDEPGSTLLIVPERGARGIDAMLATASVGNPLDVVAVGLMPDISLTSAKQVLAGSYVRLVDTLSLADVRTEEQQINDILAKSPDLIFIVGGTDAGASAPILALAKVVRHAIQVAPKPPMVVYAGNSAVQDEIYAMLESVTDLVVTVDNIRPALGEENMGPAQQGLAAAFSQFKQNAGFGFDEVSDLSELGILPTTQSLTNIVRYLSETRERTRNDVSMGVLAVDVGSATTSVAAAVNHNVSVNVRSDIGIGHSALNTFGKTTPGNLRRWLTWDPTDDEIAGYIFNKALRPASVPQTAQDLELEYALVREAIRIVVEQGQAQWGIGKQREMPPLRPIIGAGEALASAPHSGHAALLLLDGIQPVGVTEVWLDPAGLIPAMGALAYLKPEAVVQLLDAGDLLNVGTAICAEGQIRKYGAGGLKVRIKLANGVVEKHTVPAGTLWTYPLITNQTAEVTVRASGGLSINGGGRAKFSVKGGSAGLIIDARGRPLPLPEDAEVRAQVYPAWIAGTQGDLAHHDDDIPLDAKAIGRVSVVSGSEDASEAKKPRRRRGFFGRRKADPEEDLLAELDADDRIQMMANLANEDAPEPEAIIDETPEPSADAKSQDSGALEVDEMADMMDELRGSTEEKSRKRRGGLLRR